MILSLNPNTKLISLILTINPWTQGQEVEFHEIKIQLFLEVDTLIMRSKFLIMIRSPDHTIFHEIKIAFLGFLSNDRSCE